MTITQLSNLDDRDLVRRVARGDARAFEAMYDRHSSALFGLAVRVTGRPTAAEEATQDAFLSLWRSASSYDPARGNPKTWLLGMVRNRSIDWLRRETRHNRGQEIGDALVDRLEAAERTDEQVEAQEARQHTRQLLVSLPRDQREVIELAYFKGLTHTEIAAKAGIPLGTVKGRQRLALAKMHRQLTRLPDSTPSTAYATFGSVPSTTPTPSAQTAPASANAFTPSGSLRAPPTA